MPRDALPRDEHRAEPPREHHCSVQHAAHAQRVALLWRTFRGSDAATAGASLVPVAHPREPLSRDEADLALEAGGYQLRTGMRDGAVVLLGSGAGTGIPLGSAPRWADLYRMLIRMRRTRFIRDATWLHRLSRTLHPQDESRTDPEVLDAANADVLIADSSATYGVPAALTTGTGGVCFPNRRKPQHTSVLLREDRTMHLLARVPAGELDRTTARGQLSGWRRVAAALDTDPMLRMHCACLPVPAAVVDTTRDTAALVRLGEPAPRHPAHPGGTVRVSLAALLHPGADGEPELLRHVIDSRFEWREHALPYFLEHFIRPLLRSFRIGLDTHRIALFGRAESEVGFELSPELQATGRIVVSDYEPTCAPPDEPGLTHGVHELNSVVDALCTGFEACYSQSDEVRRGAERVLGEELRYLEPRTAELLGQAEPLHNIAHTVPEHQDTILKAVLSQVQERTRARRWNAQLRCPVVLINLDLCGLVPLRRTFDAVRAVSGPRDGAPNGVVELANPESLPLLPTHLDAAWRTFVAESGLGEKYPEVDWGRVHTEFQRAFRSRGRGAAAADTVNAGLARFVWDVRDAGGHVVFTTERRERYRRTVENLLAAAGVPESTLLLLPDERGRASSTARVRKLRELHCSEVLAVFDNRHDNRVSVLAEYPAARAVAVDVPGMATGRRDGQLPSDTDEVIGTFETTPRPQRDTPAGSVRLSNTHSLEELHVGALRRNRMAQRWAVHLSERESHGLVRHIVSEVDRSAARVGRGAAAKFGVDESTCPQQRHERQLRALHHVLTRKQFLKGARSNYRVEHLRRDVEPVLRRGAPIDIVLFGFPVKQCLNRLKALGPLPDLAELGALARLRELSRAVSAVYPPGVTFNILTDGRHFRTRPYAITESYRRKLHEYIDLVGLSDNTTVEEIDVVAAERLGPAVPAERSARIAQYRHVLARALRHFDITDNPLRTLDQVHRVTSTMADFDPWIAGLFREMLMSLVYSVPVTVPSGTDRLSWSTIVYADVYNVTDPTVSSGVRQARAAVLQRAWHTVLGYLATLQVDEEFGYERMFPNRVRLTVTAGREGCLGFTYLGGSGLLPWQGTGAVDGRGKVAADFAIALLDRGFVPVFSPLLGPRQPWMMVPAQCTYLDEAVSWTNSVPAQRTTEASTSGTRLDGTFAAGVRLRRS